MCQTASCCQLVCVQLRVMSARHWIIVPWFLWKWSDYSTLFFFNCKDKTSCHYFYVLHAVEWPSELIYAWLSGVQLRVMSNMMQFFLLTACLIWSLYIHSVWQVVYVQMRVMYLWYMLIVAWFLRNWSHNPTLFLFNCKDKTSCHYFHTLHVVE